MIIISAMSNDLVIGSKDGMPWNIPEEYQQYLDFVDGNTVIMGRKSYEIFGKDLPEGTTPIVVSRSQKIEGTRVASTFEESIEIAKELGKTVFVAGGATIYKAALPHADQMYLSVIHGSFEGDTYFPSYDADQWHVEETRDEERFSFYKYVRK